MLFGRSGGGESDADREHGEGQQSARHGLRPCTGIVNVASSSQSVHWSGRCGVHKLPDCIGNPPPDRSAGAVTTFSKLRRPYRTYFRAKLFRDREHSGDCRGGLAGLPET